MIAKQLRPGLTVALALLLLLAISLNVSAGLFEWSRLGRLIPQTGFEPSVSVIAADPANPATLYAGSLRSTDNTNIVFKSTNGGATWQPASAGLPGTLPQNTGINDLVVRPDAPSTLTVALFEAGVWQSTNGGQSWTNETSGSIAANDTVRAVTIDPSQPDTLFALTGTGVHQSVAGSSWQSRSNGLPSATSTLFQDLVADPTHANTLYAATSPQGLFKTSNGGQSWSPANDGLPSGDRNIKGIVVSPVTGRILISLSGQGLWRSDNLGASWTKSDAGITYNSTLQGNVGIPIFSPTQAAVAYVYNNDGVFASLDGGITWTPFNDGFSGAETVNTMAFNTAAPDIVYSGTSISGIWSLTVVPHGRFYIPVTLTGRP